ncbi:MAG: hypothetical protein KatS3mg111_3025 [Pirellulaceae bacterium]|nr:MAG: hypothetical protein KatS3mg111_3025 [Pirellulaceae bacterium]
MPRRVDKVSMTREAFSPPLPRGACLACGLLTFLTTILASPIASTAEFTAIRDLYYQGDYDGCIEAARAEVERGIWNDAWARLLIRCYLDTGRYEEALRVYESLQEKFTNSIPLRVLGAEAYRYCGQADQAQRLLDAIPDLVRSAPWRYSDRENLLAIGKYLLSAGADPRDILTGFYDRVLQFDGEYVDAHLAIAELAIEKADYQEAVKSLTRAAELRPQDPHVHFLLAVAWQPSDPVAAAEHLQAALNRNPRHLPSLLFQAEQAVDAEEYLAAEKTIATILRINPSQPLAWALKAAIAHLQGEYAQEGEFRREALKHWPLNPEVDYRIGRVLSKHYRFQESVQYQRRALKMEPNYMAARFQLAQDLLRIGQEEEGWSLVDHVAATDKYHVVAYNLKTLRQRLEQFTTLEAPGFIVRMDAQEAVLYGPRVLRLLTEARDVLSARYEYTPTDPVTVEIFDQQSDFAIRTFGLPGGAGYLGVCFGSLITANSPATQGNHPANWESVLWHEYCHVITLQKTNNRMPRWLSEGISVYEEMQRDPSWGQPMNPRYKQMLLSDDFVPLSQLSGAFLHPRTPLHIEFAYFESALAVEYLIEMHGLPRLLKLLEDLGLGQTIDEAFHRRYGAVEILDQEFAAFARAKAEAFLPHTDFRTDELAEMEGIDALRDWLAEHPQNYPGWRQLCRQLFAQQDWEGALEAAQRMRELYPHDTSTDGALEMIARIARQQGDVQRERDALVELTTHRSDHVAALTRLIELELAAEDWAAAQRHAQRLLAVQPLIPVGHEALVTVARRNGELSHTIEPLRALLELDPIDPAEIQFQLAEALAATGDWQSARREVLYALEMAPRYREAQKLLVRLHERRHVATDQQQRTLTVDDEDPHEPASARPVPAASAPAAGQTDSLPPSAEAKDAEPMPGAATQSPRSPSPPPAPVEQPPAPVPPANEQPPAPVPPADEQPPAPEPPSVEQPPAPEPAR